MIPQTNFTGGEGKLASEKQLKCQGWGWRGFFLESTVKRVLEQWVSKRKKDIVGWGGMKSAGEK